VSRSTARHGTECRATLIARELPWSCRRHSACLLATRSRAFCRVGTFLSFDGRPARRNVWNTLFRRFVFLGTSAQTKRSENQKTNQLVHRNPIKLEFYQPTDYFCMETNRRRNHAEKQFPARVGSPQINREPTGRKPQIAPPSLQSRS